MIWKEETRNISFSCIPYTYHYTMLADDIEVDVYRYAEDRHNWNLECKALHIDKIVLDVDDLEEAKHKALEIIRDKLIETSMHYGEVAYNLGVKLVSGVE